MDNMSKTKKLVSATSTLIGINGMLHVVCAIKIIFWGSYMDIETLPTDPDYYFKNRLPIMFYFLIIGGFMFITSFVSFMTHVRDGEKPYSLILCCWVCTILSMLFNFASGAFLMIWIVFNSRLFSTNNIHFVDQPQEYQSMYFSMCFDAGFSLIVGFVCSLILFYQDSVLLAQIRISSTAPVEPTRRTSQLPKLFP